MPLRPVRDPDPLEAAAPPPAAQAPLRIAMLCLHTSPLRQPGQGDAGGMNVYVRQLALHLVRQGHVVDLVTLWRDAEHPGETRPAAAVTARAVEGQEALRLVTVALADTAAVAKDELPRHLPAVARALREAGPELLPRPDVLHGHYWLSGEVGRELARAWGRPLAVTLHTSARGKNALASAGESREPPARERAEQRLIREASVLVVNTEAEAEQLRELYGAAPDRVRVIAPGVDLEVFSPAAGPGARGGLADAAEGVDESSGADGASPVIGFAGRLQALKGPQILVEALGQLAGTQDGGDEPVRARLMVAGVGDERFTASLQDQARRLGVGPRIEWLGSLPVRELARRMAAADVWAVPSSSETFGLVALEAQACGTPVLASRVGGLSAAVDDGRTGWLVEPRTPEAWARALRGALADPQELARRGEAAARRARGFSWAAAARAHLDEVYGPLHAQQG